MKIKKPYVYFIIKIFLIEYECKTPYGCLTFILYQKYFYDKTDVRLSYFHVKKCQISNFTSEVCGNP